MVNYAKRRLDYLERVSSILNTALISAPAGHLKSRTNKGHLQLYIRLDNKEIYLAVSEAGPMATKRYHIIALKAVNNEIKALNLYLKYMPDVTYEKTFAAMPDELKPLISPAVMTDEQYAEMWTKQPFKKKGFHPNDNTAYYTKKGERVRSKSEIIIADMLNDLGIPYRYEMAVTFSNGTYLFHPDFTILKVSTREELYLEHLGKMDSSEYMDDFVSRYRIYQENGILLGKKLFFTCESEGSPLDTKMLREFLIKTFM